MDRRIIQVHVSNRNLQGRIGRFLCLLVGVICLCSPAAKAQQASSKGAPPSASPALPDAPSASAAARQQASGEASPQSSSDAKEGQQTKRILGIIPNFRAVSANVHLPPQTAKQKFTSFAQDTFDYSSFIFDGMLAGISQLQNSTPEFRQEFAGYGRYYWHTFVDQTDENLWVEFIVPVALHQDPRYYTLGKGTETRHNGFWKRTGYALSRAVVTRTDAGGKAFNFSEVVGAGAASGISNLYYPSSERTFSKTGQRWGLNVGIDAGTFVFKEFWPDINRAVFHNK
jgi:hypothetical protein